ncbi:MAG: class I SAM-dependent methyltransferase [Gammaproteobacteria bacterium]|nr:class I SAM-dependent methyltransferase [Gammaproteobacteria bacterium]
MAAFSNPAAYERWMGRWSARLAPAFVNFVDLPKGGHFLDVGSGTGALSAALLEAVEDSTVVGIEPAEAYVNYSRDRLPDDRVRFEVGDALAIPFEANSFDATLSLLILQELSDAPKALQEMRRVTRRGRCVAASQWNFNDGLPMLALFWDAVIETIGTDAARDAAADCMVVDYPDDDALRQLWRLAGLVDVEAKIQEIPMAFTSFDDYWTPFLSGVTATSSYVAKLDAAGAGALKDSLYAKVIGSRPDRPFTLNAQAWAIRGLVP